jgi:protein subunit release factor B
MDLPTEIVRRLAAVGVDPAEVTERFVRGSGPEVRCQRERSQAQNRETAWAELCGKLERRQQLAIAARQAEQERARRRNRRRSTAQKARLVAGKRHRAAIKSRRGRVED